MGKLDTCTGFPGMEKVSYRNNKPGELKKFTQSQLHHVRTHPPHWVDCNIELKWSSHRERRMETGIRSWSKEGTIS